MALTETNINQLLVLCQQGNQLAQLEVYSRYQNAMYNVALRIVKETAEAEDIMQEGFITAFSKLDTFKGTATFGAWLKRIVINKSISKYHYNQKTVSLEDSIIADEGEEALSGSEAPPIATDANRVMSCMDGLHESYRQILTLHFIEGYDYDEICEIMQISYANCRTLVSRAKQSLRKQLSKAS
ncbi:RNA polymerase sigma factor [Luteirhabdus pelagi]|uniref:RNA polymerase sigma factor n=1 Tax=Luteirhabdus pelagi TaxID=2792783 RepID=UPI00193A6780|nr:RNA polymerase sigma factor [Luteirhabdus pelagi]